MLTKFDLVYLSQSNLINLCARENILVFSSFLCFFLFHILHFFFLNIKVLITEKLKDLERKSRSCPRPQALKRVGGDPCPKTERLYLRSTGNISDPFRVFFPNIAGNGVSLRGLSRAFSRLCK